MSGPARIDTVLERVRTLWKRQPDRRLTQLIVNLVPPSGWSCPEVFNFEDDQFVDQLRSAIQRTPAPNSDDPNYAS